MKKVGIMSMHRIYNYGSFLQAYGLYKTIKELGYDVEFIDYHYDGSINAKSDNIIKKIYKRKNIIKYIKMKSKYVKFKSEINKSQKNLLNVTDKKNYNKKIDTLVIGSDEVFNCMQGYPVGYSLELFGKNFENSNIISYAASFGYTTKELLDKYDVTDEISSLLKKFSSISVRDDNSKNIIEQLTGKVPTKNLDPVLISNYDVNSNFEKPNFEYIILYAYQGRISKEESKYIKKFAKKKKRKIISLGFYQEAADINLSVSPLEVFDYFKYADYIITDTFHGTIFSIKMNKKFCTIIRKSNYNKLTSLLESLDQKNRIAYEIEDIEKLYEKNVDYDNTNKIIELERLKTIRFLKDNI